MVGLAAFLLGLVWLVLTGTALNVAPSLNPVIPILLAACAGGAVLLVRRWAHRSDWQDVCGSTLCDSRLPRFDRAEDRLHVQDGGAVNGFEVVHQNSQPRDGEDLHGM